jgi:hypothetical protein
MEREKLRWNFVIEDKAKRANFIQSIYYFQKIIMILGAVTCLYVAIVKFIRYESQADELDSIVGTGIMVILQGCVLTTTFFKRRIGNIMLVFTFTLANGLFVYQSYMSSQYYQQYQEEMPC